MADLSYAALQAAAEELRGFVDLPLPEPTNPPFLLDPATWRLVLTRRWRSHLKPTDRVFIGPRHLEVVSAPK